MKFLQKFLKYRSHTMRDGIPSITFKEWVYGRLASKLSVKTAVLADKRGDHQTINAILLSIWIGNQSGAGHHVHKIPPYELSQAIKEDRVSIIVSPRVDPIE